MDERPDGKKRCYTEPSPELTKSIENSLPKRLERYGFSPKEVGEFPNLVVDHSIQIGRKCEITKLNSRVLRVKDFAHLRTVFGSEHQSCAVDPSDKSAAELARLMEQLENGKEAYNSPGRLRRLAQLYLYTDHANASSRIQDLLDNWRGNITLVITFWNEIIIQAGRTLSIDPTIHILWTNRLVIEPGGKLAARGSLRIDAHSMESYS